MLTKCRTKFVVPQPKVNDSFEIFELITSVIVRAVGDFHAIEAMSFINHTLHNWLNGKLTVTIKLLASALQVREKISRQQITANTSQVARRVGFTRFFDNVRNGNRSVIKLLTSRDAIAIKLCIINDLLA